MIRIRGRDTVPEKRVRSLLHRLGFHFSLRRKDVPGSRILSCPHGDPWFSCTVAFGISIRDARNASMPSTRRPFWEAKLGGNVARDGRIGDELESLGWQVMTVWECELADEGLSLGDWRGRSPRNGTRERAYPHR